MREGILTMAFAPSLVVPMIKRLERVSVVQIVGAGQWEPRPGREEADAREASIPVPIDLVIENRFPDGFGEAAARLLAFLERLPHPR